MNIQYPQFKSSNYSNNYSNLNDAFSYSNQLIEKSNFTNTKQTLHNNLNDNLLSENVVEYLVNIDSDDRKIETYPDPFYYTVSFRSSGKEIYKNFKNQEVELPETPAPVITRAFKNVKFVKLDHIILSKYCVNRYSIEQHIMIDTDSGNLTIQNISIDKHCYKNNGICNCFLKNKTNNCHLCSEYEKCIKCLSIKSNTCVCNFNLNSNNDNACHTCGNSSCCCSIIDNCKFIVLKIKELQNNRIFSTNTATSDNTFVLYADKNIGNSHNMWLSRQSLCSFPANSLYNLNRLTIEFCNNRGERIQSGIILNFNITINKIRHTICLIFGSIDKSIEKNICYPKIKFPMSELCKINSWYKILFNNLVNHVTDTKIRDILNNNYDIICKSMDKFEILDLVNSGITNNVFFVIGVMENGLNTMVNYE